MYNRLMVQSLAMFFVPIGTLLSGLIAYGRVMQKLDDHVAFDEERLSEIRTSLRDIQSDIKTLLSKR